MNLRYNLKGFQDWKNICLAHSAIYLRKLGIFLPQISIILFTSHYTLLILHNYIGPIHQRPVGHCLYWQYLHQASSMKRHFPQLVGYMLSAKLRTIQWPMKRLINLCAYMIPLQKYRIIKKFAVLKSQTGKHKSLANVILTPVVALLVQYTS
jgi:hypothetical protein